MKSDKEKKIYIKPFCIGLFVLKENISFLNIHIYIFIWLLWVLVADHPTDALL